MGWLKAESEDSLGEWELAGGGEDRRREGSEGNCLDKCTMKPSVLYEWMQGKHSELPYTDY